MLTNVKNYLQFFLALSMVLACPKSLSCGFELEDVKAAEIQNGVPLYVEASLFDKNVWERLSKRAQKAKQKYGTLKGACPEIKARVQNVMDKLFKGSGLEFLQKGPNKLELAFLCSKNEMAPVARIVAGKYLLVPASLPLNSHSEDAMAAVISHEIAHYTLRHHARLLETTRAKNGAPTVSKKRFQEIKMGHEREADLTGLRLLHNAGYNPESAISHLKAVETFVKESVETKTLQGRLPIKKKKRPFHLQPEARAAMLAKQIKICGYPVL